MRLIICNSAVIVALFISGVATFAESPHSGMLHLSGASDTVTTDVGIVGLHFSKSENQSPAVVSVFDGTPASKADLKKDDLIVEINGVKTTNLDTEKIYKLLSGKPETIIMLKVERSGTAFTKRLTRMHAVEFAKAHPDIWKLYLSSM